MPRTTRAALRSKELAEESATAASVPLPTTPQKERVPLGEIADNKGAELTMIDSAEQEPVKQGVKKGRKLKGAKKGNKKTQNNTEEPDIEILEDGNQSSGSSAVEEARQNLKDHNTEGMLFHMTTSIIALKEVRIDQQAITDEGPQVPTSPAVNTASDQLSPKATPQFDPELHQPSAYAEEVAMKDADDSFEAKIESRTPQRPMDLQTDQIDRTGDNAKDHPFVEQANHEARRNAYRGSRILWRP